MRQHWCAIAWLMVSAQAWAQNEVDYPRQIKPVLQARCYACHGALKQEAGLRLDTVELALKGGENGPSLSPGDASKSLLVHRISAAEEGERMPPEGEPLKPAEIDVIKKWIVQGVKSPADEQPERDPRDHWAFKTPVRPVVPDVSNKHWIKNPIDAFVAAAHQQRNLSPRPVADKRIWLRRVSLDLIGLPPTLDEQDTFIADQSPEAYDKVVARLLDSPEYGERWGRHWMDIWRYSDWWGLGAEVRNSQKHIWHWRDWIIESLNADKGYDQMMREMLAADELYPNDLDRLRASGFLARQYFKFNRTSWLDETIEHTSKAMLGLTFNCAKCHDHKYDPFSQAEYYSLRAIFEPYQVRTDAVPGEIDFEKNGIPRAFDCNLDAQTFIHIRGDDRNPDKSRVIEPSFPTFLSQSEIKIEPVALPSEAFQPGMRPFVVEAHLKRAEQRIAEATTALETARKNLAESEHTAELIALQREKERQAAERPADALMPEGSQVGDSPFLIRDDFAMQRPDIWELRSGRWTYENGRLKQTQIGATRTALRVRQPPPHDFEASLKYIPSGGDMWKSVGITFDVTEQEHEILAYFSSYAAGSKAQIAYKQGANYIYPPEAALAKPVELNKPHEMILRVRGNLVNLTLDGQHTIAYRLPQTRQRGALEVITFDAQAEFLSFELSSLDANVALTETSSAKVEATTGPMPLDQARLAVLVAEKTLATCQMQPDSIRKRAAADRARYRQPPADDASALIAAAAHAERIATVAKSEEDLARAKLEQLRAAPEKKAEADKKVTTAMTARDAAIKAAETPGDSYTPISGALKTLESNLESEASRSKLFPTTSTGRRSALARWMTDARHPLPARVAVNHIWARHFGRGIVPTVFDFGRKGTPPTHPELLDWLAVELIENNWSMKHIHRLIVTSNTYRMTSSSAGADSQTLEADPDNRFYWRASPIRMEAQLVRDSLLFMAGELDLTRGGPSIPVSNEASRRRSLYFVHSHNEHQKFLSMFDDASVLECYRRAESIVPQQALALENSPLAIEMADKIRQRVSAKTTSGSDTEFIRFAFRSVLSVEPSTEEMKIAAEALVSLTEAARRKGRPSPEAHGRTNLIQALLNHNDFVTVR